MAACQGLSSPEAAAWEGGMLTLPLPSPMAVAGAACIPVVSANSLSSDVNGSDCSHTYAAEPIWATATLGAPTELPSCGCFGGSNSHSCQASGVQKQQQRPAAWLQQVEAAFTATATTTATTQLAGLMAAVAPQQQLLLASEPAAAAGSPYMSAADVPLEQAYYEAVSLELMLESELTAAGLQAALRLSSDPGTDLLLQELSWQLAAEVVDNTFSLAESLEADLSSLQHINGSSSSRNSTASFAADWYTAPAVYQQQMALDVPDAAVMSSSGGCTDAAAQPRLSPVGALPAQLVPVDGAAAAEAAFGPAAGVAATAVAAAAFRNGSMQQTHTANLAIQAGRLAALRAQMDVLQARVDTLGLQLAL